jgi:MarR family transcriptional regulator, organic hydroperoxide resistance regulator
MRAAEHIRYLALAVQREGNRQLTADLRPLGLTPSQSEVLRIVGDHAPMTLTDVGRMLVCDSGTNPSRIVDRLVEAGLLDRTTDPADRRRATLHLTPKGRTAEAGVRRIEDAMYDQLDAAFAGVDMAALISQLGRLVAGRPSGLALEARIAAEG